MTANRKFWDVNPTMLSLERRLGISSWMSDADLRLLYSALLLADKERTDAEHENERLRKENRELMEDAWSGWERAKGLPLMGNPEYALAVKQWRYWMDRSLGLQKKHGYATTTEEEDEK